ncbi:MAG: hypothetical protein ABI688_01810 [Bacteroidota bacterium]
MKNLLLAFFLFSVFPVAAQSIRSMDIVVNSSGLKYHYTGEIRNGKADGRGLAVGINTPQTYFGEFANGLFNGQGVLRHEDGRFWAGTFRDGMPRGQIVFISEKSNFYYGAYGDDGFDGKTIMISRTKEISIGISSIYTMNGRQIFVNSAGDYMSDAMYVDSMLNGPGYSYQLKDRYMFKGMYKNNVMVSKGIQSFPSFMGNAGFTGKSSPDGNIMCSALDENGYFNDTSFVYDKRSGVRNFGNYIHGKFMSGIGIEGDTLYYVANFDENGNRQGICAYYNRNKSLVYGYCKDDKLAGRAIYADNEKSSVFIGELYGDLTGTGMLLAGDKSFQLGSFSSGSLEGEGIKVNKDGLLEKGVYEHGKLVGSKNSNTIADSRTTMHPKDACTAVNFLVKNYESEFRSINDGTAFSGSDPFTNNDDEALGTVYFFPGAVTNKIIPVSIGSLRHQPVFKSGIAVSKDFSVIKKRYDLLCSQLKNCSITSLSKKPLKLVGKITPLVRQAGDDQVSFFTFPGYMGKAGTMRFIIAVTQYDNGYQLELIINNKSDQGW